MKNRLSQIAQSKRNSHGENLALNLALPVGLILGTVWWLIFSSYHRAVTLNSWPSLATALLIDALIIAFFGFIFGYLRGQKLLPDSEKLHISKLKLVFDCITLSIGYTIIVFAFTLFLIIGISAAFTGLAMPPLSASLIIGIIATITTYGIITTSVHLRSNNIVNAIALFVGGGVFLSMATSQNPQWWEINFSSLGTSNNLSAYSFNITLVLSGLLLLCLTDHLLQDLEIILKGANNTISRKISIIKILFISLSLSFAGVGLFPWDIHPTLHTSSAYLLVIFFTILIASLKYLIPKISNSFLVNSYAILAILLGSFIVWQPLHYFSQTAYELLAFCLTFVWLILFLKTISNMRDQVLANSA